MLSGLTEREYEVLRELAAGRSNAATAKALFMSERAVEKHVGSVFTKLGILHESDVNRRVMAVLAFSRPPEGRLLAPDGRARWGQPPAVRGPAPCRRDARKGHDVGEEPMTEMRVLVVDDQVAYRRALAAVVTETDGFVMVARRRRARSRWRSLSRCARTSC